MRSRSLVLVGAALSVLSLGLPWRWVPGTPTYLTSGYYVAGFCDWNGYCWSSAFIPGVIVPGLPGGSYPGFATDSRFFIVAALGLALIGGLYLGSRRALRWAAYVGVAGILLYVYYGLMGGLLALAAASVCFWLAARRAAADAAT
jgi:hypothetical protein